MSKRSQYLSNIISLLSVDQIKLSAEQPSAYMTRTQVLLHYVALRRLS
jgi:hypothetical protein